MFERLIRLGVIITLFSIGYGVLHEVGFWDFDYPSRLIGHLYFGLFLLERAISYRRNENRRITILLGISFLISIESLMVLDSVNTTFLHLMNNGETADILIDGQWLKYLAVMFIYSGVVTMAAFFALLIYGTSAICPIESESAPIRFIYYLLMGNKNRPELVKRTLKGNHTENEMPQEEWRAYREDYDH